MPAFSPFKEWIVHSVRKGSVMTRLLLLLIISFSFFHAGFAASIVAMISDTTAVTPHFVFAKNFTNFLPALMTPDDVSCSAPFGDDGFHEAVNPGALPENQKRSWSSFYQFKYGQKDTNNFNVKYLSPINVRLFVHYTADANSNLRLLAKADSLTKVLRNY
jgi:hypothetical protein